ncbi:hypothetical protein AcW1_003984 [Taiwanofungus camphoratus]|nr:hypothetical protein AcW1_003984 [Antrodia cinnamomea]
MCVRASGSPCSFVDPLSRCQVFSAYGPQLGSRLHLSHTQLNVVGLSGNIGVYGSAPLWGRIVDTRGPRILFLMAFVALVIGYSGVRHFYDTGLADGSADLSYFGFCTLVFFGFLTGIGGNGGLASAMNATAKSWPDRARATTNGIVISGFGLSAFLFSSIAHVVFPGNTSAFLLVLAVGTSLPMVLGFFLIRPIPLPHSEVVHAMEDGAVEETFEDEVSACGGSQVASPTIFQRENNSHTHLLASHPHHIHADEELDDPPLDQEPLASHTHSHRSTVSSDYVVPVLADSVALSPARSASHARSHSAFSISRGRRGRSPDPGIKALEGPPNVHGKGLFIAKDFWLLFTITALLSGTGLMYINNVGSISQALFAKGNTNYDEVQASQWQAAQVSTISIMNCLGRFSIGMLADLMRGYVRLPRSFCIILVAVLFIISQVMCFAIEDVSNLWKASALLGLAYGGMFGLFPTITIEWFGLPHFSENWGFVSLSPMIGSNIFSIAFGRNLDAHAPKSEAMATGADSPAARLTSLRTVSRAGWLYSRDGPPSTHQCLDGRACYVDTLKLTITACCVALVLALYAGWRDQRRQAKVALRGVEAVPEVVWEEDEG